MHENVNKHIIANYKKIGDEYLCVLNQKSGLSYLLHWQYDFCAELIFTR